MSSAHQTPSPSGFRETLSVTPSSMPGLKLMLYSSVNNHAQNSCEQSKLSYEFNHTFPFLERVGNRIRMKRLPAQLTRMSVRSQVREGITVCTHSTRTGIVSALNAQIALALRPVVRKSGRTRIPPRMRWYQLLPSNGCINHPPS